MNIQLIYEYSANFQSSNLIKSFDIWNRFLIQISDFRRKTRFRIRIIASL